ncbi:MAG: transglutaminase family protein [Rhodospirillales bacterium]|nr:transglutaminase family protein [Rhodospirillales bacterium]
MQRLTVNHRTAYHYRRPVEFGEHRLMFRPRDSHDLRLLESGLTIRPDADVRWLHDVFGNSVAIASIKQPSEVLDIASFIVVDRYSYNAPEFAIEPFAQTIPFSYPASEIPDLGRTIERHFSDPDRKVTEWTRNFLSRNNGTTDTEEFLLAVTRAIGRDFGYAVRHEPGVQTPIETLELGMGTCRDYTVLMMEAVRSVGLAARFVSGYLYDPEINVENAKYSAAGSTHAWVQVYLPGAGWIEFDPTNGSYGGANLVPVAVTRHPDQAMPVSGSYKGQADDFIEMTVEVTVEATAAREGAA